MNKNELEVFEKLEDQVMSYADDNNYKENFAYFKIGEVEKLVDISRGLTQKIKDNYDTIDLLHAVINEKDDIINRLNKIIDDIDKYIHYWNNKNIDEKTMLILNDILLIKNNMGKEVVRLQELKED